MSFQQVATCHEDVSTELKRNCYGSLVIGYAVSRKAKRSSAEFARPTPIAACRMLLCSSVANTATVELVMDGDARLG